ncbi:hypothetical protein [Rossellomorea sp. FM04394]|uniref:capsular polysaccharide export protein, LipB/KpsS family n=1 Tax=Rossellomorea sp. FM04394 TaxID=3243076 RepID=UPI0035A6F662
MSGIKKMKKLTKKVLKKAGLYESKKSPATGKLPFQTIGSNWDSSDKPVAFMFGFNPWKREHMSHFFNEYRTAFVFGNGNMDRLEPYFNQYEEKVFIIWGFKEEEDLIKYAEQKNIKVYRVEDGFVRSVGLGAAHTLPLSIAVDSKTLYFNSREASDLEEIIQTYNFEDNKEVIDSASRSMNMLINMGVSKYNHTARTDISEIYGEKKKKRILVIGQVEDDASIRYGCARSIQNNDLVRAAYEENPDAEIIYKPHPDVLGGYRKAYSNPMDVTDIAKVVTEPLGLVDALETIDHVYTITSLAGFEALIRGIKVTCFGAPFYAGWGLTDDRQETPRRNRKVTIEELFAAAYVIYPRYLNPDTNERIDLEEAILILDKMIAKNTYMIGKELFKNRRLLEAETLVNKAIQQVDDKELEFAWSMDMLQILLEKEAYKEVIQLSDTLIESKNKNIDWSLYYTRSLAFKEMGELSTAIDNLYESLKHDRKIAVLNELIDLLWCVEGPNKKVIQFIQEIIQRRKKVPGNDLIKYAAIYNNAGYYSEAKKLVKKSKVKVTDIPYLALSSLVGPESNNGLSNAQEVYRTILSLEGSFESKIAQAEGSVCVVGEEKTIQEQGDFIDGHKVVIRINNFNVDYPNSIHLGTKTNVWFRKAKTGESTNVGRLFNEIDLILLNETNYLHADEDASDLLKHLLIMKKIPQSYPHSYFKELVGTLGHIPSDELLVLYWIYKIQGPLKQSSVVGISMDNLKSLRETDLFNSLFQQNDSKSINISKATVKK